jgi:hypothetical protein
VDSPRKRSSTRQRAAALIIVLAFVVLVTGLAVAYFSRTTSDRPVAHSSFHQSKVDQLAQSAMDNIIGDLRQEIAYGSISPTPATGPPYIPTSAANMVPQRSPNPAVAPSPAILNLIRRSVRSEPALWPDPATGPARGSRASAVNSTTDVSANGRSVSFARWNSHYLIPKSDATNDKSDPITPTTVNTGFNVPNSWAPDWVFVTSAGATPAPAPADVVGRYAYAIYDEGGLVDVNAAGYPSPTTILQYGRKGSLAFADLTGLGSFGLSTTAIDNIVGWRNYASSQPIGSSSPTPNFSFSTNATNTYYNFILSDPNYIKLRNYFTGSALTYSPIYFLTTAWQAPQFNNQTDQTFATRQQLIAFRKTTQFSSNALQYLGTLSREALASAPQWSLTTPDSINPNFQTLLVTASFTRNDGTTANVGDYLVDKRFLLQRLNWLTYKGPSATRTIPIGQPQPPTLGSADYDMWLLTRPDANSIRFGLSSAFLQDAVKGGTAANILKYFGLAWDTTNERWNYVGHSGSSTPIASLATLGSLTGTREPDFFELLQAGILDSSLGDSYSVDSTLLPAVHQQSKMFHILTIGANLIAQSRVDSYPVRIACSVGGTIMEAVGAPRLPYLNGLSACPVAGTAVSGPATGGVNWLLVPNLWDPFRDTWDLAEASAGNTGNGPNLTPGYLRPLVRISVSGSVGLGTVVASPSVQTGIVSSALVTPSPTPTAVVTISPTQSLALTTPTATPGTGRNGFLEASRISTADVTPTPPAFTTTTSVSPTPVAEWNNVLYPTPTASPTPVGANVVFRISFPGSSIPATWTSPAQNPVLILQPGFQITVDYQSPNGTWYSYSFLQGNNATNTWISGSNAANPSLNLTTTLSTYGLASSASPKPNPTILTGSPAAATLWNVATLAEAPMFAKADPRSIRYNSQIGVISLTSPPSSTPFAAGIIGSIWPSAYATPPTMTIASASTPAPSPTPILNPNPAIYSQVGDNGAAASNPYGAPTPRPTVSPTPTPWADDVRPIVMNRPFRSVGEMGYAFRDQPFRTLSFSSTNNPDAGLLDLFTTNAAGPTPTPTPTPTVAPITPTPTPSPRSGVINLNSLQAPAIAAVLKNTIRREDTPRQLSGGAPSPSPSPITITPANDVATSLVLSTSTAPLVNRADLANLIASLPDTTGLGPSTPKTQRESVARALGEVGQTRTWNLMIDVIAQSGRYPPGATQLHIPNDPSKRFIVEGEQRYWVHVAIDRFTGQVIDKQIEVVNE